MRIIHGHFHVMFVVIDKPIKNMLQVLLVIPAFSGYLIFQSNLSPLNFALGLPFILAASDLIINSFFSNVLSVISPSFNKGICRLRRK